MKRLKFNFLIIVFLILIILGADACSSKNPPQATEQASEVPEAENTLEETEIFISPTPTQEKPTVILVVSQEADAWTVERVNAVLQTLALESGLALVVDNDILAEEILPEVKIVVGIGPGLSFSDLANSNPETAFVVIGQSGMSPGSNLSMIGGSDVDQQHQSFMAGYLAALISSDYKVAGLLPSDSDLSQLITDAFVIGAEFFCGACNPLYPPYQNFPQWEFLSIENAPVSFQPIVDTLFNNGVEVLYVQGDLLSPELLIYLSDLGIKVVSDQSPDTIRANWVGTVRSDPGAGLMTIWPELLAGKGGEQVFAAIVLTDTDANLVSEGRMRLFEEMSGTLAAGLVSPDASP